MILEPSHTTSIMNDVTLEDEYEITRLDALPPELRNLAALHAIDQFKSVPPYIERFSEPYQA